MLPALWLLKAARIMTCKSCRRWWPCTTGLSWAAWFFAFTADNFHTEVRCANSSPFCLFQCHFSLSIILLTKLNSWRPHWMLAFHTLVRQIPFPSSQIPTSYLICSLLGYGGICMPKICNVCIIFKAKKYLFFMASKIKALFALFHVSLIAKQFSGYHWFLSMD